jgi:hypothetical protein
MKYHIPSTYIRSHPAVNSWRKELGSNSQLHFLTWLRKQTGTDLVTGNFEDGWTIHFHDDATYTWFLLKWG